MTRNVRIIQTRISPTIFLSTAAIYYDIYNQYGLTPYYQYETFCFADEDPKQHTFQVIHGTSSTLLHSYLVKSIKVHRHISKNLKERVSNDTT
jgi:hypothetical protein